MSQRHNYNGRLLTVQEIADAEGCSKYAVYGFIKRHGSLEGFTGRMKGKKAAIVVDFKGERLTFPEVARRLGCSDRTARRAWQLYGHFSHPIGPVAAKGQQIPHLQSHYYTLDPTIPLDRCIAAAGYRSIRQFCVANGINQIVLGCWRQGKLHNQGDSLMRRPDATALDEMTNFGNGMSLTLAQTMAATGCLEWELFPDLFTEDYYRKALAGLPKPRPPAVPSIESKERKAVVHKVLGTLPARERKVVELTFGLGPTGEELTYVEIGRRLGGVTRERVRAMLKRAMARLLRPSLLRHLAEVSPYPTERMHLRTPREAMRALFSMKCSHGSTPFTPSRTL